MVIDCKRHLNKTDVYCWDGTGMDIILYYGVFTTTERCRLRVTSLVLDQIRYGLGLMTKIVIKKHSYQVVFLDNMDIFIN